MNGGKRGEMQTLAGNRSLEKSNGFRPKKRLGQYFLRDGDIINGIISVADFDKSDQILEIGAGLGALTIPAAKSVHDVIAVEKDDRLVEILKKKLLNSDIHNVTLINDDILKVDLPRILGNHSRKIKVVGNLPYNISSPLLERLINNRNILGRAILMFQAEFAKRLIASPGNRDYGALTVLMQYHAYLSPLIEVPKEAFYPKPKVGSMVLELDLNKPHPRRAADDERFKMVVKGAFAYKRKTLLNSLRRTFSSHGTNDILAAMSDCAMDSLKRAESLTIDDFIRLTSAMSSHS